MIDDRELQALATSTGAEKPLWTDCIRFGDRAVVALPYLVMELPAGEIQTTKFEGQWPEGHESDISKWRDLAFVPRERGERAQVIRETQGDTNLIRLESPSEIVTYMYVGVYDVLCRQYLRPTFHLHAPLPDGRPSPISVYEGQQLVAVVSSAVLEKKEGWSYC